MPLRRRLSGALAAAAALAVGVAGCADAESKPSAGRARVQPAAAPAGRAAPVTVDFSGPAIGGGRVEAATFRGRPTLLWFWAPW